MSAKQDAKQINYGIAVATAIVMFAAPIAILTVNLQPLLHSSSIEQTDELRRSQPGMAISFTPQPLDMGMQSGRKGAVFATETLNRGLAIIVLTQPLQTNLLPLKSEAEVVQALRDLKDPLITQAIDIAYYHRAQWTPAAPPWGMFLLPGDQAPDTGLPFGVVYIGNGIEKTRIDTEDTLNRLNANMKRGSVIEILQAALATQTINEHQAIKTLAGSQVLNIQFRPEHGLFLSEESLATWNQLKPKLF